MATGRITSAALLSRTATGRITAAGVTSAAGVGRITAASVMSVVGPSVSVQATLSNLEPGVAVTATAIITGFTPSAITWSCDFPGLVFSQVNNTMIYKPPARLAGVTINWTATVSRSGGADITATTVHNVLPHAGGWMYGVGGVLYPVLAGTPPLPAGVVLPTYDTLTDAFTDSF